MKYNNPYYDDNTVERVLMHAHRLVDEMCTIRDVAEWSDFSKTTVHRDVSKKLQWIDYELYEEAKIMLELNTEEGRRKGGIAAYPKMRQSS